MKENEIYNRTNLSPKERLSLDLFNHSNHVDIVWLNDAFALLAKDVNRDREGAETAKKLVSVIKVRYFYQEQRPTLEETGKKLGLAATEVRALERMAIRRLRIFIRLLKHRQYAKIEESFKRK